MQDKLTISFHGCVYDLGLFPLRGQHNRLNFLAAVACAKYFNLDWNEIESGIKKLVLPPLRWEMVEKNGILFINDSYNASPMAVKMALENMPKPEPGGRKIAVLADMKELGQFSEMLHREVAQDALKFVDHMFCYGIECRQILDCWQTANRPVQWFPQLEDLTPALRNHLKTGDVVLIKGSRSTKISKLLEELEALQK